MLRRFLFDAFSSSFNSTLSFFRRFLQSLPQFQQPTQVQCSIRPKVIQEDHVLDAVSPEKVAELEVIPGCGHRNRNFRVRRNLSTREGKLGRRRRGVTWTRAWQFVGLAGLAQ
jgi:hypothetical protein